MLTRSTSTRIYEQRKDHIDPKGSKQRNRFKQLQTHDLPNDDVENINSPNKERELLLANNPWVVHREAERMPQKIPRHSRVTFHRSAHTKLEHDQTEKSRYGLN